MWGPPWNQRGLHAACYIIVESGVFYTPHISHPRPLFLSLIYTPTEYHVPEVLLLSTKNTNERSKKRCHLRPVNICESKETKIHFLLIRMLRRVNKKSRSLNASIS